MGRARGANVQNREQWLQSLVDLLRDLFREAGYEVEPIHVGVGCPRACPQRVRS